MGITSLILGNVIPNVTITSVAPTASSPGRGARTLSAFCRVAAAIRPIADSEIRFEVWLPLPDAWNHKFVGTGNGGYSGVLRYRDMETALERGYATVGSNTGHEGRQSEIRSGHPGKINDCAFRAVPVMTDAAKLISRDYYGSFAGHAYFTGCSTGGVLLPGAPLPDNMMSIFFDYDFGPNFKSNDLSGAITIQPPGVRGTIPMLVPRTEADGNETSGVASVLHQAPFGTWLGRNVTSSGYLKGRACGFSGGYIPFARTKAKRLVSGDPRPSLEERYGTHQRYLEQVRAAAAKLVKERFLLPDHAEQLIREAEQSEVLK